MCQREGHKKFLEKLFQPTAIDVAITDIFMPEQDGLETIIHIRQRWPTIKIIAVTGSDDDQRCYLRCAELLGANKVLMKPFRYPLLAASVYACLPERVVSHAHRPSR